MACSTQSNLVRTELAFTLKHAWFSSGCDSIMGGLPLSAMCTASFMGSSKLLCSRHTAGTSSASSWHMQGATTGGRPPMSMSVAAREPALNASPCMPSSASWNCGLLLSPVESLSLRRGVGHEEM